MIIDLAQPAAPARHQRPWLARCKRERPAMPAFPAYSTLASSPLRRDPAVDLALEHFQRHRSVPEHLGVELADVEVLAQRFFGTRAQLLDLELADLVRERLAGDRHVAFGLGGGLGLALGRGVEHVLDYLVAGPA